MLQIFVKYKHKKSTGVIMTGIIIALLYIFTGCLVLLLNMLSAFLLMNKFPRTLQPITIHETSDILIAALSGLGLICDGCLYLNGQSYCSSCSRYFLIHTLLIFPSIVSHFSVYGICIKHIQDSSEKLSDVQAFQQTIALIWTAIAWLTALVFTLILWNSKDLLWPMAHNNTSFTEQNETRQSRGIVDNLWQYNSNEDWSSDYRESVIIGLIYGIVQGNISHDELQKFHGISLDDGLTNRSKNIIREFHTALGISENEQNQIFNYEKNNVKNKDTPLENTNGAQNSDVILSIPYTTKHENDTLQIENPFHKLYNQVYTKGSTTNPLVSLHRDNSDSEQKLFSFEDTNEEYEFNTTEPIMNDAFNSMPEQNSGSPTEQNTSLDLSKSNASILRHNDCVRDSTTKICEIQVLNKYIHLNTCVR